jgi:hypothetical protein
MEPDKAIAIVIKESRTLDWSTVTYDLSGFLIVRSSKGEDHVFALKTHEGKWIWVGYFTTDSAVLDALRHGNTVTFTRSSNILSNLTAQGDYKKGNISPCP